MANKDETEDFVRVVKDAFEQAGLEIASIRADYRRNRAGKKKNNIIIAKLRCPARSLLTEARPETTERLFKEAGKIVQGLRLRHRRLPHVSITVIGRSRAIA